MANWRDYSSTNYAYEPFETDEANRLAAAANGAALGVSLNGNGSQGPRAQMTESRTLNRPQSNGSLSKATDRNTYSLPRTNHPAGRPRTHSNNSTLVVQPDFYFMPSQRRYSGYPDYQ